MHHQPLGLWILSKTREKHFYERNFEKYEQHDKLGMNVFCSSHQNDLITYALGCIQY